MTYLKNYTLLGLLMLCLYAGTALAANIVIVNADGPNEGFNDPTVVIPIGENTGTTLGEQRLEVFRYAAFIWGALLNSEVEIEVDARFDALSCNSYSAVLGSAGATTVHGNFSGAPMSDTWYPQALANALAGSDLYEGVSDLVATFNSSIDNNNNCLIGTSWYLGLDGNNGGDIDLADVVMHEIGHGLGFASYVDASNGLLFHNMIDIYSSKLEDHSLSQTWEFMSNAERRTSAIDSGDLHFVGINVDSAASGHVPMYAPNSLQPGSSVSHWDTSLTPNQLMEPFITNPPSHDPGLAYELMLDLGWMSSTSPPPPPPPVTIPNTPSEVQASYLGPNLENGWPKVTWLDESDDEDTFTIWRESPHKKRVGVYVGGLEVGTAAGVTGTDNDISFEDETGDTGTFRYCVGANNSAGSSVWACSSTVDVTNGDPDDGGGGKGDFCTTHPNHKRC